MDVLYAYVTVYGACVYVLKFRGKCFRGLLKGLCGQINEFEMCQLARTLKLCVCWGIRVFFKYRKCTVDKVGGTVFRYRGWMSNYLPFNCTSLDTAGIIFTVVVTGSTIL